MATGDLGLQGREFWQDDRACARAGDAVAAAAAVHLIADAQPRVRGDRGIPAWPVADSEVWLARDGLLVAALSSGMDGKTRRRLAAQMQAFERQAAAYKLSASEVTETYRQVTRLLAPAGETAVARKGLNVLAEQVLTQAANPAGIDQGKHQTCALTALEVRLYARDPAKVARVVADIALANKFTMTDGRVVSIDRRSLVPDEEAARNPVKDGKRSFASQLFQVAAANMHWQTARLDFQDRRVASGSLTYVQFKNAKEARKAAPLPDDVAQTSERILDTSKNPPAYLSSTPEMRTLYLPGLFRRITGRFEPGLVLETIENSPDNTVIIESETHLRTTVAKLKSLGKLPALLRVHAQRAPFQQQGVGWHLINVMDADAGGERISISNQWGDKSDRVLSSKELFLAMWAPRNWLEPVPKAR